jgi:hypothetical protein
MKRTRSWFHTLSALILLMQALSDLHDNHKPARARSS